MKPKLKIRIAYIIPLVPAAVSRTGFTCGWVFDYTDGKVDKRYFFGMALSRFLYILS